MMKRRVLYWGSAVVALAALGIQLPSKSKEQKWPSREEFRLRLIEARKLAIVFPDRGPEAASYQQPIESMRQRSRFFELLPVPLSAAADVGAEVPLALIGTPASNSLLAQRSPHLPLSFTENGFSINRFAYDHPNDVIALNLPDPENRERYLLLLTGNRDQAIANLLAQRRRWLNPIGDYAIWRGDHLLAYGHFSQPAAGEAWVIDEARETNFARQRQRVADTGIFTVDYIGPALPQADLQAFIHQQTEQAQQMFRQLDISESQQRDMLPIRLLLYATAESKTIATNDSRYSSWEPGLPEVHIVFGDVVRATDFSSIAEYIAWHWAGDIPNAAFRNAAGILFSRDWGREGYPVWAGRLFHAGFFVPIEKLVVRPEGDDGVSRLITGPQLATFLQFILFHDGVTSFRQLLKNMPASITAEEFSRRFSPALVDNWQRWCKFMLPPAPPERFAQDAAFEKGFCFAHEGYSIYNGYLGSTSRAALQRLAAIGANSVSITPFGYPQAIDKPSVIRRSDGPGAENDESVVVAGRFARKHGMRIMLKPHIWVRGQSWHGDIKMTDPADWPEFFANYERWMAHYAIVAQMDQFESLVVGVELVQATVGNEAAWEAMIARLRKLYGGKMLYSANWGTEFENVAFWDALDAIGISCYYPLSDKPGASDAELLAGARDIARRLEKVATAYQKPVVLTEIGFASRPSPWVEPFRDGRGASPDVQAQKRCYEIAFQAFYHQPWLQGMYWWKWPTSLDDGGAQHSGFTPNGKPAEMVVSQWYNKRTRPQ